MNSRLPSSSARTMRPPIAILGVPFDNVTKAETIQIIDRMIASGRPHYLVTPNVDFLVQARRDIELRRILFEAHLVLCDGTPLVWASRMLGNRLPERVAGADVVPLLIQLAAQRGYRIFLLGASPDSAKQAVERLRTRYPELVIAGHYSPPFTPLLDMDHEEIRRRILMAKPDVLLVSFGCPKQEKWVAMHYRALGVPVTAGVGATIDFLAGHMKRAPRWMQRSGTEWLFRLAQEPRRLFRRYVTDLWVFGTSILPQWWQLRVRSRRQAFASSSAALRPCVECAPGRPWRRVRLSDAIDFAAVHAQSSLAEEIAAMGDDCVLDLSSTTFLDSTGVGFLIRLQKQLRANGRRLVLFSPSPAVLRALALMRLTPFFHIAWNESGIASLLTEEDELLRTMEPVQVTDLESLPWRGEVTAGNADRVWQHTHQYLSAPAEGHAKLIDLSAVRFIDSTGLGLMVRAKKLSLQREQSLRFVNPPPAVLNVLRLAQLEGFILDSARVELVRSPSAPN